MELRKGRLKNSPYQHKTYLGLYLGIFLFERKLTLKQASKLSGISHFIWRGTIKGDYTIGIQSYFRFAEFMTSKSVYNIDFFLRRLKEEFEKGDLNENK